MHTCIGTIPSEDDTAAAAAAAADASAAAADCLPRLSSAVRAAAQPVTFEKQLAHCKERR